MKTFRTFALLVATAALLGLGGCNVNAKRHAFYACTR
jgi:hypothetical protein